VAHFVKPFTLASLAVPAVAQYPIFESEGEHPMANTSKRGFASMDAAKQREIASKGGRAAHAKGTAHEFTSDEARVAGRKGGEAVSRDRAHMSAIGREGGHSRGRARQSSQGQPAGNGNAASSQTDMERSNFVGQANDRGNAGNSASGGNGRERSNENSVRNENAGRG
jgi:general stress protein YciG